MKPIERSFQDWESHVFGFGYGTGEPHVLRALKVFFDAFGSDDRPNSYEYQNLEATVGPEVTWLLINILCRWEVNVIEYGTSPRFAWLTPHGERLRAFLAGKTVEELENILALPDPDYCAPDCCNCGPDGHEQGKKCENPFWKCR